MEIKLSVKVKAAVKKNIFAILDILNEVGIPLQGQTDRRLERVAKVCMAIGNIKTSFSEVKSVKDDNFLRTREIISYINKYFGEDIADGSYDDIRRKDLKLLVLGNIAINSASINSKATNDGNRAYCLSNDFAELLKTHGTNSWNTSLQEYKQKAVVLKNELEKKREIESVPVTLPDGTELLLSYGEHNQLQKAIIEKFLPYFGKGCCVLYVGDTGDKLLYKNELQLKELGFFDLEHEELPDIIAYNKEKDLLFLIEAYHCTGQWDKTRLYKVKNKLKSCKSDMIFVTAFETLNNFRTISNNIAWETEAWIAEIPEHMIHFNGWKFLEIHENN